MPETERTTERVKCDWQKSPTEQPCGSEEAIYSVSTPAKDYWGNPSGTTERNICQKHLGDAWNSDATEAHPIDVPTGGK